MNTVQYIRLLTGAPGTAAGTVLLFFLAAFGLGYLFLKRDNCISLSLGIFLLGFLSFLFFPLPTPPAVITFCLVLLFFPALVGLYRLYGLFRRETGVCIFGVLLILFFAGSALLLPVSWDEQVYQIELLTRYLSRGSTGILMDNPYSAWPGFLQSFLLPGFYFSGLLFPRLFNSVLSVVLILSLYSQLRHYGFKNALAVSLAVLLSPLMLILNRSVYAENTVALFFFAGLLVLKKERKEPLKAGLLAGLFAGGLLAVKLTAGGAAAALFFMCTCLLKNRKACILFILTCLLAALPFYLRIFLATGNPFYPFGSALFGTSSAVEQHHHLLGSFRYGLGPLYGTVFGWITTAFAGKLYDGIVLGFQLWVLIALPGAAFYFNRGRKRLKMLQVPFGALLILYLFWGLTAQQSRFLFPAFFLLALLAAAALFLLKEKIRKAIWLLLLAGILCTPQLLPHLRHNLISWRIIGLPWRDPLRYLAVSQNDPDFIRLLEAAGETPPDSRFLLLFEKRGLYLPRKHEIADPGFQEKYFTTLPENTDDFLRCLGSADYLLIGSGSKDVDLQEKQLAVREKLLQLTASALREGKLEQILSGNSCHLLKIKQLKK